MNNNTRVRDLDLPRRVQNALIREGYMTLGQLRTACNPVSGFRAIPGIGFKGELALVFLLQELEDTIPDNTDGAFCDAGQELPMSTDERSREFERFLSWIIDQGGLIFMPNNRNGLVQRLLEVHDDGDVRALIAAFEAWEVEEAVLAAEARLEP
jgi:hypothetical protein